MEKKAKFIFKPNTKLTELKTPEIAGIVGFFLVSLSPLFNGLIYLLLALVQLIGGHIESAALLMIYFVMSLVIAVIVGVLGGLLARYLAIVVIYIFKQLRRVSKRSESPPTEDTFE